MVQTQQPHGISGIRMAEPKPQEVKNLFAGLDFKGLC